MNRWLALVVALAGGAVGAWAVTLAVGGALFGLLWIFVFGDDPWPAWVNPVAGAIILVVALGSWASISWLIWVQLSTRR